MLKAKSQGNQDLYQNSLRRFNESEKKIANKMNEYIWLLKGFVQVMEGGDLYDLWSCITV